MLRGSQEPLLRPTVKLLVRQGGQPLAAAQTAATLGEEEATATPGPGTATPLPPTPTATPVPPTPTPTPLPPTPTPSPTPIPPTPTATPPPPTTIQTEIINSIHLSLVIRAGDSVVWTQLDADTVHTSTSGTSPIPDDNWDTSFLIEGQSSAPIVFNTVGTFPYFCQVHPEITATITVIERDATGPTPTPGPASSGDVSYDF